MTNFELIAWWDTFSNSDDFKTVKNALKLDDNQLLYLESMPGIALDSCRDAVASIGATHKVLSDKYLASFKDGEPLRERKRLAFELQQETLRLELYERVLALAEQDSETLIMRKG